MNTATFRPTRDHVNAMRGYAMSITRNAADAADITQSALLRATERWHMYDPSKGDVVPWLLTIVRNLCINAGVARATRYKASALYAIEHRCVTKSCSPEDDIIEAEQSAIMYVAVRGAFETVSEPHRTAVRMRDFDGASYKEIAAAMGCPMGTVMSRIRRGRVMLMSKLTGATTGRDTGRGRWWAARAVESRSSELAASSR